MHRAHLEITSSPRNYPCPAHLPRQQTRSIITETYLPIARPPRGTHKISLPSTPQFLRLPTHSPSLPRSPHNPPRSITSHVSSRKSSLAHCTGSSAYSMNLSLLSSLSCFSFVFCICCICTCSFCILCFFVGYPPRSSSTSPSYLNRDPAARFLAIRPTTKPPSPSTPAAPARGSIRALPKTSSSQARPSSAVAAWRVLDDGWWRVVRQRWWSSGLERDQNGSVGGKEGQGEGSERVEGNG